ncbi:hypothetical protein CAPTEDRAFT_211298 [Capitella teleta]|uniref:G-protein coupled receptors family 1 profile domain-containing protein n=1 Tax=Capitella teleta TaxID=283909 RepID=R7TIP2_CAPTE|nr:hypothetical protein CAPTEDRAFT_211298 [Capitella teleta]|eukprot:ELT93604.1 hypothetical protein CAPTEDRAFT_211298 [Capitella teleta]
MSDGINETMTRIDVTELPQDDQTEGQTEKEFDLEAYYYKLSEDLFVFFDPIIVLVGLVGAALIIAVTQRRALSSSSVSVYMTALAVSDAMVLILDFLNNWLKMEIDYYILGSTNGFCKFHRFFFNVAYTYSGWCVVAMAVEKVIVVWFPFKAKSLCNKRNAVLVVCLMPVPIIAIYMYNLWAWELTPAGECDMVPQWVKFQSEVGPWLSGTVYSYVPIILLVVLNSLLCQKLWVARKARQSTLGIDKSSPLQDNAERKVTTTVVLVCTAYILLTLPLALFYIIMFLAGEFLNPGPQLALGEVLILIFGLSNHAVNFFLIVLTSARFRRELSDMFCCGSKVNKNRSGRSSTNTPSNAQQKFTQNTIFSAVEMEKPSAHPQQDFCSSILHNKSNLDYDPTFKC